MSIDYSSMMFPKTTKSTKKPKIKNVSEKNRIKIKNLFKGMCGLCGEQGNHIHHIYYRSEAPDRIDDLDNLFLLCYECHDKVHANKKYWQPRLVKMRENFK